MDVVSIGPGQNFRHAILCAVDHSAVLLVVIGPQWLNATDKAGGRRLDNSDDPVRVEVETALARALVIIPVLTEDTPMPDRASLPFTIRDLADCHAIRIRHESFSSDLQRLVSALSGALKPPRGQRQKIRRIARKPRVLASVGVLILLVVTGGIWLTANSGDIIGTHESSIDSTAISPSDSSRTSVAGTLSNSDVPVAKIESPSPGDNVSNPVEVTGSATIPTGFALWVLVRAPDHRYYLTTDGPVAVDATNHWRSQLTAGRGPQDVDITFSLHAVYAPALTSSLDAKVAAKKQTGSVGGGFDVMPSDASVLDNVELHLSG